MLAVDCSNTESSAFSCTALAITINRSSDGAQWAGDPGDRQHSTWREGTEKRRCGSGRRCWVGDIRFLEVVEVVEVVQVVDPRLEIEGRSGLGCGQGYRLGRWPNQRRTEEQSSAAQGGQGARAGRRHDAEEARGGCDINRLTQLIAFGQDRQGIAHLSGSQWFPLAVASERLLRAPIGERGDVVLQIQDSSEQRAKSCALQMAPPAKVHNATTCLPTATTGSEDPKSLGMRSPTFLTFLARSNGVSSVQVRGDLRHAGDFTRLRSFDQHLHLRSLAVSRCPGQDECPGCSSFTRRHWLARLKSSDVNCMMTSQVAPARRVHSSLFMSVEPCAIGKGFKNRTAHGTGA
ncbi:uncharacterized protein K444DRAFT_623437 [Hyaloscypha bicolor E]|uniref:Uncharacterized protein n=1 Tax=Hyaloscypha bicolor E TaxID=1095630 RepID=A0A2J6TW76_9HELO|nr:uncharacterized protein K444DRAFT_623437 [Hyaloscypha bicolor E]PMD67241.1 hypothetical protein K444DRAFT_623437 [Hyaloscypha bicolor E]